MYQSATTTNEHYRKYGWLMYRLSATWLGAGKFILRNSAESIKLKLIVGYLASRPAPATKYIPHCNTLLGASWHATTDLATGSRCVPYWCHVSTDFVCGQQVPSYYSKFWLTVLQIWSVFVQEVLSLPIYCTYVVSGELVCQYVCMSVCLSVLVDVICWSWSVLGSSQTRLLFVTPASHLCCQRWVVAWGYHVIVMSSLAACHHWLTVSPLAHIFGCVSVMWLLPFCWNAFKSLSHASLQSH